MKIKDTSFCKEAIRFIGYGAEMGWHERNAGNVSLRLEKSEREEAEKVICSKSECEWLLLKVPAPSMASEYVFTTVTGSYFIDMDYEAENNFCICEISADGKFYRVLYGVHAPTSEFSGHLLSLSELKKRNGGRAVYHCHPANAVALSYLVSNEKELSTALWKSETECAFVFPEGVGLVPFYVPGSIELATATAEKIKKHNAVIWSHHGIFASGDSIKSAFGLAHAIEKSAEIRLKIISSGMKEKSTISNDELIKSAEFYNMKLDKTLLQDEK